MIKPSVGRVVLYHPSEWDQNQSYAMISDQPFSAEVVYVWNDRLVNLVIHDHYGTPFVRTSVELIQPEDPRPPEKQGWAYWMEYQIGQAAKAEALQAKLEEKTNA